jgi:hypothetical protein
VDIHVTFRIEIGMTGFLVGSFGPSSGRAERTSHLDNGVVRVGIDLDLGGSITFSPDHTAAFISWKPD